MGLMCYLCRRKASKRDRISLHKFPSNPILRNSWIEACNLSVFDDVTHIYICSLHFNDDNIDRGNEFQTRCTLKNNAIPSIGVPSKPSSNSDITYNNNNVTVYNVPRIYENVNTCDNVIEHVIPFDNQINNIDLFDNALMPVQDLQLPLMTLDDGNVPQCNTDASVNDGVTDNFERSEECCYSTPKRRKFAEPRYISEIQTPDFKSPKTNRRILNLVRDNEKKKTKLIKSLRDRKRKLEKKISSLEEIIKHLKEKDMVSNGTGDNSMTIIAGKDLTTSKEEVIGESPEILRNS